MTPEEQEASLDGAALRLAREARGWAVSDVATRTCMSVRQIRQLEEGGESSFYSSRVKLTAAKRVADVLGVTDAQLFNIPQADPAPEPPVAMLPVMPTLPAVSAGMVSLAETDALNDFSADQASEPELPLASELSLSAAVEVPPQADEAPEAITPPDTPAPVLQHPSATEHEPMMAAAPAAASTPSPKMSMWPMVGLFLAALGVAAVMRPGQEPVTPEAEVPAIVVPATPDADKEGAASVAPALATASAVPPTAAAVPTPVAAVPTASVAPAAATASAPLKPVKPD